MIGFHPWVNALLHHFSPTSEDGVDSTFLHQIDSVAGTHAHHIGHRPFLTLFSLVEQELVAVHAEYLGRKDES